MDQQGQRGRSPSVGHQQPHIRQSHSPSPNPYQPNEPSIGLGLGLDPSATSSQSFAEANSTDFAAFNGNNNAFQPSQSFPQEQQNYDPSQNFNQQFKTDGSSAVDDNLGFATQPPQQQFLNPSFGDGDFSLFPPTSGPGDAFNTPLFDQGLQPQDMNAMATTQTHHSPTPPHLLGPDGVAHQPGSAHHSPAFNQHQFSSPSGHQRNASLGPPPGPWGQPQFQGHRRTPSEFSERSSAAPSPNLVSQDTFDQLDPSHSPMQRPSDPALYDNLNMNSFTISDNGSHHGRSPSHSPAISPRILPQSLPDMNAGAGFGLAPPIGIYGAQPQYQGMQQQEAFPTLNQGGEPLQPSMVAPAINIDFAPNPNSRQNSFEPQKTAMDMESLTPPERGRPRSRPRAVTDPFNSAGSAASRSGAGSLSPHLGADLQPNGSRSLSPLDRQSTSSPSRRRQSTSAVPNNVMALRIANPEYQSSQDNGGAKRAQKHPATFQCTLCPKRFTRAYNLRSHLRTHTDERPFVCTVCGKAFARQHDRKRHEGLHSGEKKFVCKGDLKVGGQWGCGRRFARADALGRHFRSEAGRICIKPLLDEEMLERQRMWQEQRMQQNMAQSMAASQGAMALDPNTGYPLDAQGQYALPAALLAQYPALAQMNWNAPDMGGSGLEDEMSGRSSFDASDYDENEDGYVSGPGTGFGEGGMSQNFGEMGYASDYGGR